MSTGKFIGIDFGTTNTAVFSIHKDEKGSFPKRLGEGGDYPFSSIVAIPKKGGELLFGREVRERREELAETHEIHLSMKPFLGTDKRFRVGDEVCTATDITYLYLQHIKNYIAREHGMLVSNAGFSFPVDFSPEARRELKRAAERAGIEVTAFISEATAAYIANRKRVRAFSRVMVIDWGGGTLDISVLDLKEGKIFESALSGERIGGDDIDIELARRIHSKIANKFNIDSRRGFDEMTPAERDQMIMYCERAKMAFSENDDEYPLTVRNYGPYGRTIELVSYGFFEEIVKPIIVNKVLKAIDSALMRAGTNKSGIDAVIIVGGSSNLRPFANAVVNMFGEEKIVRPYESEFAVKPEWSVAEGAAIMGIVGGAFHLNSSVGILLSDGNVYPVLEKHKHTTGTKVGPITFSLVEDSEDAHFIIAGEDNSIYKRLHVRTKGFHNEPMQLEARIGDDQIAVITVYNRSIGVGYSEKAEINKLAFYYDLSDLDSL